jgi:hypothetical protein
MAQAPSPARFAHDLSPLGRGGPAAPSFTSPQRREAGPKGRVSGFGARRSTIRVWTLI